MLAISRWLSVCGLVLALAACGGGDSPQSGPASFAQAIASKGTPAAIDRLGGPERHALALGADDPVDASAVFDWAQWKYPQLFPGAPANQGIEYLGVTYTIRAYEGGNYLGITDGGAIYGLGTFTGGVLTAFGSIADYAAQVRSDRCSVYPGSCGDTPRAGTWGGLASDGAVINFVVDNGGVKLVFAEQCNGWASWTKTPSVALSASGQFTFTVSDTFNSPGVTITGTVGTDGTASGSITRSGCAPAQRTWTATRRSDRTDVSTPIGELTTSSSIAIALGTEVSLGARLDPSYGTGTGSETFAWSFTSKPADSLATLGSGATLRFTPDVQGIYRIAMAASNGIVQGPAQFTTVTVGAPKAVISGLPESGFGPMIAGQPTVLDATRSTDSEGDRLTYSWALVSKPAGSNAVIADASSPRATLTPDKDGFHTVQLTVSDGRSSVSTTRTLSVSTRSNIAPYADAGPDQDALVGRTITLDGSASAAIDGTALSYAWTVEQRPPGSTAQLADASSVRARFTPDREGTYAIKLTAKDSVGWFFGTSTTVTVTARTSGNTRPMASAGADRTVSVGASVALDATGSRDTDGNMLRYEWALLYRPAGSDATLADAATSAPVFVADRAGPYVVQLIVSDGSTDSVPDTVVIIAH